MDHFLKLPVLQMNFWSITRAENGITLKCHSFFLLFLLLNILRGYLKDEMKSSRFMFRKGKSHYSERINRDEWDLYPVYKTLFLKTILSDHK